LINLFYVYHYDARGATAECADLFGSSGKAPKELLVEPNVSMRQPLTMLLTIVVRPFTWGCQQVAPRV
jgi:hypothetical protein